MNLPNKLTIARLCLTVVFVVLFYVPLANRVSWALVIFLVASFTDYLDGEIARRRNLVTDFGKLMDPLADKILMAAALVMLAAEPREPLRLPAWTVIVVLAREFFVTGIRLLAMNKGAVLAAEKLGKHKTLWQMITVVYFMAARASAEPPGPGGGEPMMQWAAHAFEWKWFSPHVFGFSCLAIMVTLTLISGLSYFQKNRALFMHDGER
ncbi:MAG: CDP-diacylglycerol--glycerol-3-phosphate 3-phosphatidyltransferase [Verrucomicrobiaceae bacterium]